MKNIIKYIVLGILLLVALTVISTLLVFVFGLLLKVNFENIWSSGFKVAALTEVIIIVDWVRGKRSAKKEEEEGS